MLAGLEYGNHFTVPFMELSRRGALVGANTQRTLTATVEVAGFVSSGGEAEVVVDDGFVGPPWPPADNKPVAEAGEEAEGA
jgi:hypothetical protein